MGRIKNSQEKYKEFGLTKQQIDDILEKYSTGRAKEHIRVVFGISEETLMHIIEFYGGKDIEEKRQNYINKWEKQSKGWNMLGRTTKDQKTYKERKNEPTMSIIDAIKNVEGDER